MAEQEIREKIAKRAYRLASPAYSESNTHYRFTWDELLTRIDSNVHIKRIVEEYRGEADQILALFPEWAKANGYKSPKDVSAIIKAVTAPELLETHGYVKLAKNQTMIDVEPLRDKTNEEGYDYFLAGWNSGLNLIYQQGWRRMEGK